MASMKTQPNQSASIVTQTKTINCPNIKIPKIPQYSDINLSPYQIIIQRSFQKNLNQRPLQYKMQIRQVCFFSVIIIMIMSTAYLIYLSATSTLPFIFKLRFINFILQHLLGIAMLFKRQYYCNQEDTCSHLKWMIGFTGINFFNFVAVQIYGIVNKVRETAQVAVQNAGASFIALSYCHLYFQTNIYLGVFCLFSMVMGVVFLINQRRHTREMQQALEDLHTQKYEQNNKQENCSICLAQFQPSDSIYKLVCGHVFHKDCLKDWFKQKLTCPMCRDNVGRPVQDQSDYLSDEISFESDESDDFHNQIHANNPNFGRQQFFNHQNAGLPQFGPPQQQTHHRPLVQHQEINNQFFNNPR